MSRQISPQKPLHSLPNLDKLTIMKTIGIQELPAPIAHWLRLAALEDTVITDQGRPLAVVKTARGADLPGKPFPPRDPAAMPFAAIETSQRISDDRDGR